MSLGNVEHPASGLRSKRSRPSLSGRQELRILIPTALLTLVLISVGTLFAYRSSVEMMQAVHERRATELASAVARGAESGSLPNARDLRQRLPRNARSTIRDEAGRVAVTTSPFENEGEMPRGNAAFLREGDTWSVEVELPSPALTQSVGRLRVLVPLVLGINAGVVVLVLVYLRKLLMPLGQMLASAEKSGRFDPQLDDEVDFLIATFDAAMRELASPQNEDLESVRRLLVADLESGVLLCDQHAKVLALNAAGANLLGVGDSFAGTALAERAAPRLEEILAGEPGLLANLRRAMIDGRGLSRHEVVLESSSKPSPTTLGMTLHVLRRDDHEPRGFLVLFVDLTAAREQASEQRLGETFEHVGEIAAGIAHELRNGVATLRGYLTLIERADGEDVADYAAELRRETEHLQRVVDDFLTLSRPGATRIERLDVGNLVARAALDPALGESIDYHLLDRSAVWPLVIGDAELLIRALRNLLLNAIQASAGDGCERPSLEVAVMTASEDGELVEIAVLDRGEGVPAEVRERLFHPFVTGRRGGVGLGLSLCLRIAKLHHGSLRVENRDGGGTRAALVLPLDRKSEQ